MKKLILIVSLLLSLSSYSEVDQYYCSYKQNVQVIALTRLLVLEGWQPYLAIKIAQSVVCIKKLSEQDEKELGIW